MIETDTLRIIVLVLFGLTIIWFFWILIKKEFETLPRVIVVAAVLGLALLFLQNTKLDKISWNIFKRQILPQKTLTAVFEKKEGVAGGARYVCYQFREPGPEIKLTMDPNRRNFHITDIGPVNRVLSYLGLPEVSSGVRELSSLTGRSYDINTYRWEDYPSGILILERGICHDKENVATYHCIVTITIRSRD